MASLNDFPLNDVIGAVRRVNDRSWDRSGRLFKEVDLILPIEDARLVCAAALWIDVLITAEAKTDRGSAFSFDDLYWMIKEKTQALKLQKSDEKWLQLGRLEMKMMMDIETHLDRYASRASNSPSKKWSGSKKGKKN